MSDHTFADRFCAQHGIPREQYARAVFKRTLYRRALPIAWFLAIFRPDFFSADFYLIFQIEHIRRLKDFVAEAEQFHEDPANRGWLRHRLLVRVSTSRLKNLVKATLPSAADIQGNAGGATAMPVESPPESARDFMTSAGL